jgi:hypothetical protein
VFVDEDIHICSFPYLAGLLPLAPRIAVAPTCGHPSGRIGWFAAAPVRVHGDAAKAFVPFSVPLLSRKKLVGGTLVDANIAHQIFVEGRIEDVLDIRIVSSQAPIDDVIDPVIEFLFCNCAFGSGDCVVVGDFVLKIQGVHGPRFDKLVFVVHAQDALGFGFGFAKGRQQHASEDCDDRNDHE